MYRIIDIVTDKHGDNKVYDRHSLQDRFCGQVPRITG